MRTLLRLVPLALSLSLVSPIGCSGGASPPAPQAVTPPTGDVPDAATTDGEAPGAATPEPPPPFTVATRSIVSGGATRAYTVAVPRELAPGRSYPLVLAFHGDGGDGAGLQRGWAYENATDGEAIVVYPDSLAGGWSLEYRATSTTGASLPNRDVTFVADLIAELAKTLPVDASRTMAAGWSNGAFFAHVLACRRPDLVRAVAANAGDVPNYVAGTHGDPAAKAYPGSDNPEGPDVLYYVQCSEAQKPVAAFVVQGALDSVGSGTHSEEYWAIVNGCGTKKMEATPSPCVAREGCPASAPVVLCEIPRMGHVIWDQMARASWTFFRALP